MKHTSTSSGRKIPSTTGRNGISEVEGFDKTPNWAITKRLTSILCKHVSRSPEMLEHPTNAPSVVDLKIDRKQIDSIQLNLHLVQSESSPSTPQNPRVGTMKRRGEWRRDMSAQPHHSDSD